MSVAEGVLYNHLTNSESLDYIIREGFTTESVLELIPSEVGRKLVKWSIDHYFENGRKTAPSKDAIMETWGDQLSPLDIKIEDEYELDSIQWAVEQLRADYANFVSGEFAKMMVTSVAEADSPDRAKAIIKAADVLHGISQTLMSRKNSMYAADGVEDSLRRYEINATEGHEYSGLQLGLTSVDGIKTFDEHFLGIHDGELAVLAGTAGGGKSWFSLLPLLAEFERGRRSVLYTLENDLEATFDRLACMRSRVPYEKYQRGECDEGELIRINLFLERLRDSEHQPLIIHPKRDESTGASMIRRALSEGADSVIIDQLSHVQPVAGTKTRERNLVVAEIVQDLNYLVSEGAEKLPLLLLHQINRKGREEARKAGRYLMEHLGEATQVENEADFVFAIYQSSQNVVEGRAELQTLKARRMAKVDWEIEWRPASGDCRIRRLIENDQ